MQDGACSIDYTVVSKVSVLRDPQEAVWCQKQGTESASETSQRREEGGRGGRVLIVCHTGHTSVLENSDPGTFVLKQFFVHMGSY